MPKIAVIDCETDPFEYGADIQPFIWGFYDGTTYFSTVSTESLVDYLKDFQGTVYAHNGGKFDYFFLLDFIPKDQRYKIINGRLSEFRYNKCVFRDSINILPLALAKFKKDDFEYWKMAQDQRRFYMDEIEVYLESDCRNLYEIVNRFITDYSYSLTLAGAAVREYKKLGGVINTTSETHYENYAPYYFGGRVSCFESGVIEGDFKIVDINSAYPAMMKKEHPTGSKVSTGRALQDKDIPLSFVTVECTSYGAFPLRQRDGSITFPHEYDTYKVTGREFKAAYETGTIKNVKIKEVITFEKSISFCDYVDHFFSIKHACEKAGDKAGREIAKLFLNSLYGKFAANPNKYMNYWAGEWGQMPPDGFELGPLLGNTQFFAKELEDFEKQWYNVATAASITGAVRAFLWESINKVERPLYCDTDSIICANTGSLQLSDQLGDWASEGDAYKVAIAGKKMYAAWLNDGNIKKATKGVKLSEKEIEKVALGERVTYYSDSPTFSIKKGVHYQKRTVQLTAKVA